MISVSAVSMRYGAKVLFEDVSIAFTPGKRYGLTGPNGSGKSTFMKLLTDEDGVRLGELERIVGEEDGCSAEADAAILLQGLDIEDELHERQMSELQGGQKVRVLLAQALFGHPQALLLDEPTNHLDLD